MSRQTSRKLKYIIRPLAMILITSLLLVYGTYSWVRRQWTPTVEQSGIKIATGDSLSFMFDDNVLGFQTSLNALLGVENFVLKSVSNASGESADFFTLEYSHLGLGYESYKLIKQKDLINTNVEESKRWTELGKQYGYVEMTFRIYAPTGNQTSYVYLSGDSYIRRAIGESMGIDPSLCVRLAVSCSGRTLIFASDERIAKDPQHTGVNPQGAEGIERVSDGQTRCEMDEDGKVKLDPATGEHIVQHLFYIQNTPYSAFDTALLHAFSEYDGSSVEKTLFSLVGDNAFEDVTVRIWLEGVDPDCVNEIAGKELDLLLKFAAKSSFEAASEPDAAE